ncbi:DUF4111 domain-containing protein [Rubrobacter tropicus]|uniref:DUF4111 domain-containing protein n=2 Tax=Rubrobacter tropicus TaxID=2653851 RepID=A0A6G8QBP8_9ACTN|nr:DUF4111 domain-containing protein [Rubrobacter tropicus]
MLDCLAGEIRRASTGSLVGLYLYGSLAAGDFEPERSDIDLLAVVSSGVEGEAFDRLDDMHGRIVEDYPAWENRIEVAYVSVMALRKFKTETSEIAVISPGEPFHLKEAGRDWLINWHMVREAGVALFGPPPGDLIPATSKAEFVEAVRKQSGDWADWVHGMRTPGARSYAIVTMCRALYACAHGEQASKKMAASWAQECLPQCAPLIRRAWSWRSGAPEEGTDDEPTHSETVRFVHDVIGRIT